MRLAHWNWAIMAWALFRLNKKWRFLHVWTSVCQIHFYQDRRKRVFLTLKYVSLTYVSHLMYVSFLPWKCWNELASSFFSPITALPKIPFWLRLPVQCVFFFFSRLLWPERPGKISPAIFLDIVTRPLFHRNVLNSIDDISTLVEKIGWKRIAVSPVW